MGPRSASNSGSDVETGASAPSEVEAPSGDMLGGSVSIAVEEVEVAVAVIALLWLSSRASQHARI
jgi:hypothetical protein